MLLRVGTLPSDKELLSPRSACSANRNKRLIRSSARARVSSGVLSWQSKLHHVTVKPHFCVSSGLPGQHSEGGAPHSLHGRPTRVGENTGEDEGGGGQGFDHAQEGSRLGQRRWPADQPEQDEPVGFPNCCIKKTSGWFVLNIVLWILFLDSLTGQLKQFKSLPNTFRS